PARVVPHPARHRQAREELQRNKEQPHFMTDTLVPVFFLEPIRFHYSAPVCSTLRLLTAADSKVAISFRKFTAACSNGKANTLPVPSPNRNPICSNGCAPSSCSN